MYDIGANMVKALKHLGVSEKTRSFRFQKWNVSGVFDPPHLLKCTCNIFQKDDVANLVCKFTVNGE